MEGDNFTIEFEQDGKAYKGIVTPDPDSMVNNIPMRFFVLLSGDKEGFDLSCTPEGWVSEDVVVNPEIVKAVGDFLLKYYE